MARLRIEAGRSAGKTVELGDSAVVIGRGETAQLQISDLKALREHCKVFEQGGTWVVADLNSRNGIQVNGVQTTRRNLAAGDKISVGETVIVFETAGAAKAAAAAPAPAAAPAKAAAPAAAPKVAAAAPAPAAKGPAPSPKAPTRSAPVPSPKKGGASKKEAAFAAARSEAGRAAKRAAPAPAAGGGGGAEAGLQVSDRVLQFNRVDPRKAGVMDIDITQSPGITRTLIVIACIAFLALVVWGVVTLVQN